MQQRLWAVRMTIIKKLEFALELLRGGYIDAAYEIILEVVGKLKDKND